MLASSDELKATYLEKMVSGVWTGTITLAEPGAGSDLAAVRNRGRATRATAPTRSSARRSSSPATDMAEHRHLVLAVRRPAPEGVGGISLFVVPKFMVNADGSARCPQRCLVRVDRAQARHPRQPGGRDGLR